MWLVESEAARELRIDRRTLRKLIQSGRLRAVDVGSGSRHIYRINPDDLREITAPFPPAETSMPHPRPVHRRRSAAPASLASFLPSV